VFRLEEIVREVKVNRLLPSLPSLLVALKVRIVGNEDSSFIVPLGSFVSQRSRELSGSPCEIKHMRFNELPRLT
jgi:hypothetical protein